MTESAGLVSRVLCQQGKERVVDLVAAREDAELQQKFSSELQDIPNTIPAFKCAANPAP